MEPHEGRSALAQAQQVLEAQPFSRLLGARLTAWNADGAVLELPIRDELLQQNGFVHGGVLSYLADNALTFAGGQRLGLRVLTARVGIEYLRPAQGEHLIARATTQAQTSGRAVTLVEISAVNEGREYVCAVGTGTIAAVTE